MDFSSQGEPREVRAARNQSLFRAVNEQLKTVDPPFEEVASTHVVTCECADLDCIETLEIGREHYAEVRDNPRRFVVLDGHVYLDVERLVDAHDGYVVVEKIGAAAGVAEALGAKGI
jgi:hypothetical protein